MSKNMIFTTRLKVALFLYCVSALLPAISNAATLVNVELVPSKAYIQPGESVQISMKFAVDPQSTSSFDPGSVTNWFDGGYLQYYDHTNGQWYAVNTINSNGVFVDGHTDSLGNFVNPPWPNLWPNQTVDIGQSVTFLWTGFSTNSGFPYSQGDRIEFVQAMNYWLSNGDYVSVNYPSGNSATINIGTAPVPLPASFLLLASGILGLLGLARQKNPSDIPLGT